MTNFSFSLLTGETGPLVKAGVPDRLRIPAHAHTPTVKVGDEVLAGTLIATASRPVEGDLHAPLAGIIKEITHDAILMDVTGNEKAKADAAPADGANLKQWLRGRGINVTNIVPAATLVINGVPPEPYISIYEPLLRDYRKTVELGLETIQQLIRPSKIHLVTAKGNQANAFANCSILDVPPVYPNGIDQLVIKAATGQEVLLGASPKDATLLSIRDLYFIGRVMETGRPVTETIMTIGVKNHLVKIGTPVGFLAQEAGAQVQPGDRIILGGPMKGMPALNLQQGVGKFTTGLLMMKAADCLNPTDNFCLGCGECERHCPARIMPGMISRCAEFKHFDRAEDFHIHSCIECGICGYWCKAQRPLLQYIRLAKYELALLRTATSNLPDGDATTEQQTGEDA